MKNVKVITKSKSYNVIIGSRLLSSIGDLIRECIPICSITVVTDDIVDKLYADIVIGSLESSGYTVWKYVFPHGEHSKNIVTYQHILEFMAKNEMTRKDIVIALGGGVVGDIAGFVAATYLRGVKLINIPTTLLAAVDSSVGGKTGINLNSGKNQAGAFHQPELVIYDTDTLSTLSDVILADGYAEIIKYGMICDLDLLNSLSLDTFMNNAESIVERCVSIKSDVISNDEHDTGIRQLLNFGHTIGHAIEKLSGYTITHGHAVATGMVIITRSAVVNKLCGIDCLNVLVDKLNQFKLPIATTFTSEQLASAAMSDKKRSGNELTIVIPTITGKCDLYKIKTDEFINFIKVKPIAVIKPHQLHGDVNAIASKSDLHRELICSFLANNVITPHYISDDISATVNCINNIRKDNPILNCGESGTTLRFMLPIASALGLNYTVSASGRLPERPIKEMLDLLTEHGCDINSYTYPLSISGQLTSGVYKVAGNISSQYISGLLLALPLLPGDSKIELLSPLESSAYINMTINKMKSYGVDAIITEYGYYIKGNQKYNSPEKITKENDWSNAAFWLCAGALSDNNITCHGLNSESLQPDKEIINILTRMNPEIKSTAIDVDMSQCLDIVPAVSVLAAVADGTSTLRNIGRLRYKESDRLQAIIDNLTKLGVNVKLNDNSLIIEGRQSLNGNIVSGYNDHRIVMAMAIASIVCTGNIIITDADAVNKSYPEFFNDFNKLGGECNVI